MPRHTIVIQGETFLSNIVNLETQGIVIILGMNWLAKYHGRIDCAKRTVTLTTDQGTEVEYVSTTQQARPGCHQGMARPALEEIRVVHRFTDVFPDELPSMPPDRVSVRYAMFPE